MTTDNPTFLRERIEDEAAIDALNEAAFGPGRFARTAYRLREGVEHERALSFVALSERRLIGSVRLTLVRIGDRPALLLGPLVVDAEFGGRGIGRQLVRLAMQAAGEAGHRLLILVGDMPYYGPLGFKPLPAGRVSLPGPADPARILVAELGQGFGEEISGLVTRN